MPTYTYECRKCHHTLDVLHPMTANPRVKCPVCGGGCKRLLGTGAALILKGSGFYETDYKKSGKPSGDLAKTGEAKTILFNHSGHGHVDMQAYDAYLSGTLQDYEYPDEKVQAALADRPKVG